MIKARHIIGGLIVAAAVLVPTTAQAAPFRVTTDVGLVDGVDYSPALAWSIGSNNEDQLYIQNWSSTRASENFGIRDTGCVIGPGCTPFLSGSGLNTKFNGDHEVEVFPESDGDCVYGLTNLNIRDDIDCTKPAAVWVRVPTGASSTYNYVNVYVTNQVDGTSGGYFFVTPDPLGPSGNPAVLYDYVGNLVNWKTTPHS